MPSSTMCYFDISSTQKIPEINLNIPSVKRARPPVGWHKTVPHEEHKTTVCAWLKTVLMFKQPNSSNNEINILFPIFSWHLKHY